MTPVAAAVTADALRGDDTSAVEVVMVTTFSLWWRDMAMRSKRSLARPCLLSGLVGRWKAAVEGVMALVRGIERASRDWGHLLLLFGWDMRLTKCRDHRDMR